MQQNQNNYSSHPGARARDTLRVTGTCVERVIIREQIHVIIIEGQGVASIISPATAEATLVIRGTGITVNGFTVSGGSEGILVQRNGTATITNNTILETGLE